MAGKRKEQNKTAKQDEQPQDKKPKDPGIIVAFIGAGATIIAALIGLFSLWVKPNFNNVFGTSTPTSSLSYTPLYQESFDNNKSRYTWNTDPFSDDYRTVKRNITSEAYYHSTTTSLSNTGWTWSTVEIPGTLAKNFCLIFDLQAIDVVADSYLYVYFRVYNYDANSPDSSWYLVELNEDGSGAISSNPQQSGNEHDIGTFNYDQDKGIRFGDRESHKLKISVQGDILEIFNGQTNALIFQTLLDGNGTQSEQGNFRLGTAVSGPNQTITVAFDNIFIYNKCP